jgi:acetylornithine/succinyldiaminopimelate/putrescine aminotransferase
MGRSGRMWAWQHSGVRPDAMTVAKGLAGGLPIGALVAGPAMAEIFEPGDHGTTFGGGPVQCAAGLAVLDVIDDALLAHVAEQGELLHARLAELPGAREVRGRGFMQAVDFDGVDATALFERALREQRLVLNATGPATLRLLPPLVIGADELNEALDRLAALLA